MALIGIITVTWKEVLFSSIPVECTKRVHIWSFSGPYFLVFSPNTKNTDHSGPEKNSHLLTPFTQ